MLKPTLTDLFATALGLAIISSALALVDEGPTRIIGLVLAVVAGVIAQVWIIAVGVKLGLQAHAGEAGG